MQAMGAAVTAAAKQHKLPKAAVYISDQSMPLSVCLLRCQAMTGSLQAELFDEVTSDAAVQLACPCSGRQEGENTDGQIREVRSHQRPCLR